MNKSPVVLLYDASGVAMAVQDGVAIPVGTSGLLMYGEDDSGYARRVGATASGGLKQVQYDASGVAMPVQDGVTVPDGTSGLLTYGEDEDGYARRMGATASGGAKQVLYDEDGNPVDVCSQGGGQFRIVLARDPELLDLVRKVLFELKQIKVFLAEMHDEDDLDLLEEEDQ